MGDQDTVTIANIAAHILFLNGLNPYWMNSIIGVEWSIAVECMFYLLVPVLCKLIRSVRHAAWFVLIMVVLSFALNKGFATYSWISDHFLWGLSLFMVPESIACFCARYNIVFSLEERAALEKYRSDQWRSTTCFSTICALGRYDGLPHRGRAAAGSVCFVLLAAGMDA